MYKRVTQAGLIVCFALLLLLGAQTDLFRANYANLLMNRLIWASPSRSAGYGELLNQTGSSYAKLTTAGEPIQANPLGECATGGSSLVAWTMAMQARYHHDWGQAGAWLLRAAAEFPHSRADLPVILPPAARPDPATGNVQLLWEPPFWGARADSQPLAVSADPTTQVLTLTYANTPGVRDMVVYAWRGPLALPAWHTVRIVGKSAPGTYLTLELSTENGLNRYLNYHQGSGEWETFDLPIEGTELRYIYIILNEPSDGVEADHYQLQLQPVALRLEPELRTCIPAQ